DLVELKPRNLSSVSIVASEHLELLTGRSNFDSEQDRHDELFLLIKKFVVTDFLADKARINLFDLAGALGIDKKRVEGVHEVVAGRSGNGPDGWEVFVASQNFFDEDRKVGRLTGSYSSIGCRDSGRSRDSDAFCQ